ncbi:hypothetical protein RND81_10G199900 [Saponaria officinalis]|uniref:Uncharacterized protein n=1 Tax=Saponaria officinalis TaxID=3572 RepID=A0AAW1I6S6_SAPOF
MSGDATPLHPAFTVSNIHNHVPTKLTLDESVYETWKLLFEIHCESFQVQGHLDGTSTPPSTGDSTWKRLDSIDLSWIYATLSPTVRTMVIKKGAPAHEI